MCKYFISYMFNQGMGNEVLKFRKKINSMNDIQEIQCQISKNNKIRGVRIINYILIAESEDKQ